MSEFGYESIDAREEADFEEVGDDVEGDDGNGATPEGYRHE